MKYYFQLQYKIFNRQLTEFGIPPIIAYLLMIITFIGLSFYLFSKTEYAAYVYAFFGLSLISNFSKINKNDFLKLHFSTKEYQQIRVLENSLAVLPFALFLLFQQAFLLTLVLLVAGVLLSFLKVNQTFNWSIRTPFYKYPYEFTVGFRNTFPFLLLAFFLLIMAVQVNNFNLGIFSLALPILIALSYYGQAETHFYVWIHNMTAKEFIFHKLMIAIGYTLLLCLPFLLGLLFFFSDKMYIIIGIQFIGLLYPMIALLSKYATYPTKLNLMQAFAIGLSFWFPPLLLVILPYLYAQSVKKLTPILEW